MDTAGEDLSVIGFKGSQTGTDQLPLRYHDDIEARGDFVTTENLSNQSFGSVSRDGAPKPSASRDPQAGERLRVG